MGGRSRDRIFGDKLRGAKIRLDSAKDRMAAAEREAVAARCEIWSAQMEGYGGPAQPSPTIEEALGAGYCFLMVKCNRCNHYGCIDLRLIRRHRSTDIWRLESSLTCGECRKGKLWRSRVHMVKLSKTAELAQWYPPGEDERR